MSADENKALVRRFFEELCNARHLDLAETLMTADHRYHDPQIPDAPPGPQGMAQTVAVFQNGVEGHWGIEEMFAAEDDRVVTRWTGTGRHSGTVMGIPPTGKSVKVSAISLHRIAGASWRSIGASGIP